MDEIECGAKEPRKASQGGFLYEGTLQPCQFSRKVREAVPIIPCIRSLSTREAAERRSPARSPSLDSSPSPTRSPTFVLALIFWVIFTRYFSALCLTILSFLDSVKAYNRILESNYDNDELVDKTKRLPAQ